MSMKKYEVTIYGRTNTILTGIRRFVKNGESFK